jgi:hypothetical protein
VKELRFCGKQEGTNISPLTPININKIRSKEDQHLRSLKEEAQRIGVGVTKEAQDIFNALSKTYFTARTRTHKQTASSFRTQLSHTAFVVVIHNSLPCRWRNDTIVVFDEITIRNPYGVDNCGGGDPVMLERVKKVVCIFYFC